MVVPDYNSNYLWMGTWRSKACLQNSGAFKFFQTYTEAKVDVTQEIEQRAQQAAQPGADHCTLCSISSVTSNLASV